MDSLTLDRVLIGQEQLSDATQALLDDLLAQSDRPCEAIQRLGDDGRIYAFCNAPYNGILLKHQLNCKACHDLTEKSWSGHLTNLTEAGRIK